MDQCNGKARDFFVWYLSDSTGGTYGVNSFDFEQVVLPHPGAYVMHCELNESFEIIIPNTKYYKDTIQLPRLELVLYVSNPPHSEFLDCGELAEGIVIDYYNNGVVRKKGTFEKGQSIDSLFTYHRNGELSELFTENSKGWKRINYFDNGNLKYVYDTEKREEKYYFPSGNLKSEKYWTRKYRIKIREYAKNGQLTLNQTREKQEKFSNLGKLQSSIKKKEVLIFDRIFTRDKSRFYSYTSKTFNTNETLTREIRFAGSSFKGYMYPQDYTKIADYLFDEIIFYKDGKPHQKIHFRMKKEKRKYIDYTVVSRMINGDWTEESETKLNEEKLYQLIETLSKEQE